MNTRYYDRYTDIINKLDYVYKGYNLKYLLPGYLTWAFDDYALSARDVFKEFYLGTQLYDLSSVVRLNKTTVITYLINRSDYRDLAVAAQNYYTNSEVVNIESLPRKRSAVFSIAYIKNLFKAFRLAFTRSVNEPFMTKLFLVGLITKVFNYVHLLEKYEAPSSVEQYVCFNSAYKEESLLTLYYKKRGVETITLQHGIFCDFKQVIPFDYINMGNLIADKILCWGKSTIDYLSSKGFDDSRFILMGNPKYKSTNIDAVNQSFRKCLVLLGRQIYIPSNGKLLALLREFNENNNNQILFYLKKHPFLMDSDHKEFASISNNMIFLGKEHSVQEVLRSDLVDFTIAVNTTAYYESLALGKVSLRWSESENEEFVGMDDKFSDIEGFETKLNEFKLKDGEEIKKEMKDVIRYVFNPDLK